MNPRIAGLALAAVFGSLTMVHAQETKSTDTPAMRDGVIGAWKLEKNLSDAQDRAAGRRGGPPGGGMGGGGGMPPGGMGGGGGRGGGMGGFPGSGGGGGMPGGMPGGMGGRGGEGGQSGRDSAAVMAMLQPATGMTIVSADGAVIVTNSDGVSRKFITDDKKNELLTGDGVIKYKAKWSGPTLIIESELDKGPKVTITYIPMTLTNQLLAIVRVAGEDGMGAMLAHHVFIRNSPM
jgi:hypothetical protein